MFARRPGPACAWLPLPCVTANQWPFDLEVTLGKHGAEGEFAVVPDGEGPWNQRLQIRNAGQLRDQTRLVAAWEVDAARAAEIKAVAAELWRRSCQGINVGRRSGLSPQRASRLRSPEHLLGEVHRLRDNR